LIDTLFTSLAAIDIFDICAARYAQTRSDARSAAQNMPR